MSENQGLGMALRLGRGLWAFGWIFLDYMVHLALLKLFRRRERDAETGRRRDRVPAWLRAQRKRIDQRNARRALSAMLRLRGVYIKLGQVLSIMGGFLPRVYIKELESLQDAVPPQPFSAMQAVFVRSLGQQPEDVFERIESQPIAAASLGQVHEAYLADGSRVAVKILYPGIREVIRTDLRVVRIMLRVYAWFVPVQGLEGVHASLVDLLRRETDYLHEAECMRRMARDFEGEEDILFPEVVDALTTTDVLTMTYMEGVKITKLEELRAMGIDTHAMAERLVQWFYKQLFVYRFFHADPHPGNFLIQKGEGDKARIVVLDFGAISEAREDVIDGLIDVLEGLMTGQADKVLAGFEHMGFVAPNADRATLERLANDYFRKLLKIKDRSPSAMLRADPEQLRALADPGLQRDELRELMKSVQYPDTWFYVERASVLMFWLCATIDPAVDTMKVGFPYVMPLLVERGRRRAEERAREAQAAATDQGSVAADVKARPGESSEAKQRVSAVSRSASLDAERGTVETQ